MHQLRKTTLIGLAVFLSGLLIACGHTTIEIGMTETTLPGHWHASYETFSGTKTVTAHGNTGQTMTLKYDAQMNQGTLQIKVETPLGHTVWDVTLHENATATVEFPLYESGAYQIVVNGSEASGSFDITWQIQ